MPSVTAGIKVGSRIWSEDLNQDEKGCASSHAAGEQSKRSIAARQALAHDSGAGDCSQKKRSSRGIPRQLWAESSSLFNVYQGWLRACAAARCTFSQVVLKNDEDLPLIAVRILNPRLVLHRKTTVRLHFISRDKTCFMPLPPYSEHFLG